MHLKYFILSVMCNNKNLKTTVIKDQLRNIIGNILCAIVNNSEIGQKGFIPINGHKKIFSILFSCPIIKIAESET